MNLKWFGFSDNNIKKRLIKGALDAPPWERPDRWRGYRAFKEMKEYFEARGAYDLWGNMKPINEWGDGN